AQVDVGLDDGTDGLPAELGGGAVAVLARDDHEAVAVGRDVDGVLQADVLEALGELGDELLVEGSPRLVGAGADVAERQVLEGGDDHGALGARPARHLDARLVESADGLLLTRHWRYVRSAPGVPRSRG